MSTIVLMDLFFWSTSARTVVDLLQNAGRHESERWSICVGICINFLWVKWVSFIVIYTTLVNHLVEARKEGGLKKLLKSFSKLSLLILDEFGFVPLDREGGQLLFQVISDCYEKRSVLITTNLEFSRWVNVLYDASMTAAMIDRLVHHGHLIIFDGESYRLKHALMKA